VVEMTKPEITDYTLRKAKRIRFSSETFTRIKPEVLIEFDNNNGKWIYHGTLLFGNKQTQTKGVMSASDVKNSINKTMNAYDKSKQDYYVNVFIKDSRGALGGWFSIFGEKGRRNKD